MNGAVTPLRVLVIDDEPPARARLAALLGDLRAQVANELVGEAGNGRDGLVRISETHPDVVLVDIQMPGMNGIEMARHAQTIDPPDGRMRTDIVFCTAYDDYAVQAFEVQALDYLLKPIKSSRLLDALVRARKRREDLAGAAQRPVDPATLAKAAALAGLERRHLSVNERGRVVLVPVVDVLYLKSEMKYTTVRTREREYLIEESLTSLEEEFEALFVRIHRNALVARDAIAGYERGGRASEDEGQGDADPGWHLLLRDVPETLPVSRRQWPVVKALLRV